SETVVKGITTNARYLKAILDLEEFRRGEYDTGILARGADRLLPKKPDGKHLTPEQEIALTAAAIWQLEQDQRAALAPAAQPLARESAWARAGRLETLRRNG
ncbi:MAG TPA: acetyl-CoA carboxylase biotin carboxylase subunit, partial [Myxococcales bacterium]|nr:acetyl-CoA carboxylase biotin carboxylase subunit [Myxococcales bacterium]